MIRYKVIFSAIILIVSLIPLQGQNKDEFVLVREDGSSSVYERWITFPKSNPPIEAREVKSEFFFRNSNLAGLKLIQDEKRIQQWQKHVTEFKVYPQSDSMTWLEYSYHDIPWPVSDQDHFLKYTIVEMTPRKIFVTFESRKNETLAPVRKGVTRMVLSGSWTWEQINPIRTKVTYLILSRPIGIPKWLTDPVIRKNIMSTIQAYIDLLEPKTAQKK